jgi:hypothetical protein
MALTTEVFFLFPMWHLEDARIRALNRCLFRRKARCHAPSLTTLTSLPIVAVVQECHPNCTHEARPHHATPAPKDVAVTYWEGTLPSTSRAQTLYNYIYIIIYIYLVCGCSMLFLSWIFFGKNGVFQQNWSCEGFTWIC